LPPIAIDPADLAELGIAVPLGQGGRWPVRDEVVIDGLEGVDEGCDDLAAIHALSAHKAKGGGQGREMLGKFLGVYVDANAEDDVAHPTGFARHFREDAGHLARPQGGVEQDVVGPLELRRECKLRKGHQRAQRLPARSRAPQDAQAGQGGEEGRR
jgi:hypothetical protein